MTSGRHTKESSKRVKDDKRRSGRGGRMTKGGAVEERRCSAASSPNRRLVNEGISEIARSLGSCAAQRGAAKRPPAALGV